MSTILELAPVAEETSTSRFSSIAVGEDLSLEFLDAMLAGDFENSIPPIWNETVSVAYQWEASSIPPDRMRTVSPFASDSIPPIAGESIPPFATDSIPPIQMESIPPFAKESIPPIISQSIPPFANESIPPFATESIPPVVTIGGFRMEGAGLAVSNSIPPIRGF